MAQQQLDGAQISAAFQHMCGKAVPQRVWADAFFDPGPRGGSFAGVPNHLVGNRSFQTAMAGGAGKQVILGFFQRQYWRKASKSLGVSGTSRSREPFPWRM